MFREITLLEEACIRFRRTHIVRRRVCVPLSTAFLSPSFGPHCTRSISCNFALILIDRLEPGTFREFLVFQEVYVDLLTRYRTWPAVAPKRCLLASLLADLCLRPWREEISLPLFDFGNFSMQDREDSSSQSQRRSQLPPLAPRNLNSTSKDRERSSGSGSGRPPRLSHRSRAGCWTCRARKVLQSLLLCFDIAQD
jgi:hypothetical protein